MSIDLGDVNAFQSNKIKSHNFATAADSLLPLISVWAVNLS